jgi:excisionase family DNA binding protein
MNKSTSNVDEYVSPDELASRLGVNRDTVLRWVAAGTLPHLRPSRNTIRIRIADAMAAFERRTGKPGAG